MEQLKQISFSDLPKITREPRFRVRVSSKKTTSGMVILSFIKPEGFIFTPGQYIWLVLPELSKQYGVIDRRAFSISAGSSDKMLEVMISITKSEYSSKITKIKVGEEVDIIGPMGSAFITPPEGAIMIAGGLGITPFLSILRSQIPGDFSLLGYNSEERSAHYHKELQELSDKYGYGVILKEGDPEKTDLSNIIKKEEKRLIYVSGSQNFVNVITAILLTLKVSLKQVHYEANYPTIKIDTKIKNIFSSYEHTDISNAVKELPPLDDLFLQVTSQASNHVILTDHNGVILFANHAAEQMTGYTFNEMRGETPRLWGGVMSVSDYQEKIWTPLAEGVSAKKTIINRNRNGKLYCALLTVTPILYKKMHTVYLATEEDVTILCEIDKAKTEFVSVASHQLRAPVTAVNWYTEMLLSGDAGKLNKKQKEYLKEVYKGNQRIIELINALLSISRLELGTLAIDREPINIVALAQKTIDEQKPEIQKKKIALSVTLKKIPSFKNDAKLIEMIIQNLLSNAIKYTPKKGKITISISQDKQKKSLLITISDTGYGIPKNEQAKIFSKLFRAENVKNKEQGTGLGLYIIKSIVDRMDGKIWFESKEAKGTTFYVSIPMVRPAGFEPAATSSAS